MLKVLNLKKGFTLIELLIVMLIVSILVVMAVGGYTAYRKAALVDLNADALIAQINDMRDKTIHGTKYETTAGSELLKCFGLKFEKNVSSGVYEMIPVAQNFTDRKVWKNARWEYQGCDDSEVGILPIEIDPMVNVESISLSDGSGTSTDFSGNKFVFRFVPPEGVLEVFQTGDSDYNSEDSGSVVVNMRYGSGTNDAYVRSVSINLATGKVEKK